MEAKLLLYVSKMAAKHAIYCWKIVRLLQVG